MNWWWMFWGILVSAMVYVSARSGERFWPWFLSACAAVSFVNAFGL